VDSLYLSSEKESLPPPSRAGGGGAPAEGEGGEEEGEGEEGDEEELEELEEFAIVWLLLFSTEFWELATGGPMTVVYLLGLAAGEREAGDTEGVRLRTGVAVVLVLVLVLAARASSKKDCFMCDCKRLSMKLCKSVSSM